jgi:hypothetical protein
VLGHYVQLQLLDHPDQPRRLPRGQVQNQPGQGGGVDDEVLERAAQAPAEQIGVERVVAVLDQDRSPGEAQEGGAGVTEAGRPDQHRPVDLVPAAGVGVDGSSAVDQGVEERQRPGQGEALGPDLQDQKGPVSRGLDVQSDVLGRLQGSFQFGGLAVAQGSVEPGRPGAARLEQDLPRLRPQ